MRLRIAMFAIAVLFVTAAGAAPGNAAVRFGLRLESARVQPGGIVVDVRYVVLCPPGAPARLNVALAQRTGAHVAVGAGGTGIVCAGVPRPVLVRIAATGGAWSFRPGRARATADLRATSGLGLQVQDDRARLVVMRR